MHEGIRFNFVRLNKIKIAKIISHTFTLNRENFRPRKFPAIRYKIFQKYP